ncbi:hypothetical protein V8C35DRAFT_286655 [Trichoderma chlorosporum]
MACLGKDTRSQQRKSKWSFILDPSTVGPCCRQSWIPRPVMTLPQNPQAKKHVRKPTIHAKSTSNACETMCVPPILHVAVFPSYYTHNSKQVILFVQKKSVHFQKKKQLFYQMLLAKDVFTSPTRYTYIHTYHVILCNSRHRHFFFTIYIFYSICSKDVLSVGEDLQAIPSPPILSNFATTSFWPHSLFFFFFSNLGMRLNCRTGQLSCVTSAPRC